MRTIGERVYGPICVYGGYRAGWLWWERTPDESCDQDYEFDHEHPTVFPTYDACLSAILMRQLAGIRS